MIRSLRRNVLATYGSIAASMAVGLVVTPIVVHALGKEQYGVWAVAASATALLALLDLGVGPSVVRFAAEQRGRRAPDETSGLASAALLVYLALGVVALVAGALIAWLVPVVVDLPSDLETTARLVTLLVVIGVVARFPLGLVTNLLVARQRYDVLNIANVVSLVAYGILVALLLGVGSGGIVLLAVLALGATLVRLVLPLPWLRCELPSLRLSRSLVTRARMRELLSFSWDNFLINVAAKIVFTSDVIVVAIVLGPEAATLYAIPAKLFSLGYSLGTAAPSLLYPAFAELEGAAEPERQRSYLLAGLRIGSALILALALPLALLPSELIHAWMGPGFEDSAPVLALLAVALLFHQPLHVLSQYLIARGRQRPLALVSVGVSVLNLTASAVLAAVVGIWGVALSSLVAELVTLAVVSRLVAADRILSLASLAAAALRPVVPAAAVAVPVLALVPRFYEPDTLLSLCPVAAVWLAALAPLVWRFGFDGNERAAIAERFLGRQRPVLAASDALG